MNKKQKVLSDSILFAFNTIVNWGKYDNVVQMLYGAKTARNIMLNQKFFPMERDDIAAKAFKITAGEINKARAYTDITNEEILEVFNFILSQVKANTHGYFRLDFKWEGPY
jgi:hypothetical protein